MNRSSVVTCMVALCLIGWASSPLAGQARAPSCVDINSASSVQLERIIHIGPARATQILALREQRPFRSVDELTRVNGIAEARIRDIKAQGLACVKDGRSGSPDQQDQSRNLPRNVPPPSRGSPPGGCVDLNTASEAELQRITQIGPARARQIVAIRARDPFDSVDDLVRVDGIAAGRLAQIRTQGLACVKRSQAHTNATRSFGVTAGSTARANTAWQIASLIRLRSRVAAAGSGIS